MYYINYFSHLLKAVTLIVQTSWKKVSYFITHRRGQLFVLVSSGLDPILCRNYRPISDVFFLSMVVESSSHSALLLPLCKQPASVSLVVIQAIPSAEIAILKVCNDLVLAADKGYVTALILLGFSATFDCADHCIVLKILQRSFGTSGTILNWFVSYLSNRTQCVCISFLISSIAAVIFVSHKALS